MMRRRREVATKSTNRRMTALAVFHALMATTTIASALGWVKGARSVMSRGMEKNEGA
jgi:hypothetical protein